jgi:hypothetical protein
VGADPALQCQNGFRIGPKQLWPQKAETEFGVVLALFIESTFDKKCLSIAAPTELSFMTASLSIMFMLTNIPGNILVILAVVFDPNRNLRLHSTAW